MKYLNTKPGRLQGVAAALLSVGLLTSACGGDDGDTTAGDDTSDGGSDADGGETEAAEAPSEPITIGYVPWNEGIALTFLWEHLLTERGYDVEVQQLQAGPLYQGLASSEVDLFFDAWLPNTHESYWDEHGDSLTQLTQWYEEAPLDLAVPTYTYEAGVQSLGDLGENADMFNGQITGIDPGAGESTIIREDIIPTYELGDSISYAASSSSSMLAALDEAIANEEPIVVALWYPHWAWAEYPIEPLEDPENAWGEPDSIYAVAPGEGSEGEALESSHPDVASWVSEMTLTPDQISSLSNAVVNNAEGDEARRTAAEQWASENQDLVTQWVPAMD